MTAPTDTNELPPPQYDPSNAPPHLWLETDVYGTAGEQDPPPLMGFMALAASSCNCIPAPALETERRRLAAIGGSWLGCCGNEAHTYGFHVPACRLSSSDYSMRGEINRPVNPAYACAGDFGMNWPASRQWLRWLVREVREGRKPGIVEIIGSYDGRNVRYWSTSSGFHEAGIAYTGSGHDTWSHVSVGRSQADRDHGILAGWTATSGPGGTPTPGPGPNPQPDDWTQRIIVQLPELARGANGSYVRKIQGLLVANGIGVAIDGDFGPGTERGVRTLQANKGIASDGIWGPNTWRAGLL